MKVICFGPGPQFKGGIAQYNTALAKSLARIPGTSVEIVSWTQQYPAIIPRDFVDRSSKTTFLEGTGIGVTYLTDYNKPGTWRKTADYILEQQPDKVIFQWAIAIQGLPMGVIARRIRRLSPKTEIIFDVHVLVQKEASVLDRYFTRYGLDVAHTQLVHARKTADEIKVMFPTKQFSLNESGERNQSASSSQQHILKLFHPVYDLFTPHPEYDVAKAKAEMGLKKHVFLFFGFIRKYKGLHNVIEAYKKVRDVRDDVSLLIVGESFWKTLDNTKLSTRIKNTVFGIAKKILIRKGDDERDYNPLSLIETLGLQQDIVLVNQFVPNEEVYRYFQVSDAIITYYLTATPSGVESLAYNFELPVLATNVGHFPETIKDGFNGYLAQPENTDDMANQMLRFIEHPIPHENVAEAARHMSWDNYAKAIMAG